MSSLLSIQHHNHHHFRHHSHRLKMPHTCIYKNPNTSIRCRMPVANGLSLCGSHNPSAVPCPKCGTTLPKSSLPRHLNKPLCPVQKRNQVIENSPFYKRNINLPFSQQPSPQITPTSHSINTLLARLPLPISHITNLSHLPEHHIIHTAWSNPSDHTLKMEIKHFSQIASLSSILLQTPLSSQTQIIEIAAGRAYTSLYLAHVLTLRNHPTSILAIDRASNRYKADRTLRAWCKHPQQSLQNFRRIRIDLAHLTIENLPELTARDVRIVAKHACGAALDLALTAATNFAKQTTADVRIVLASCCRNRCAFRAFGQGGCVWTDWGLSEEDVWQICKAAQWPFNQNRIEEMAELGRACQAIVDHARVEWLRKVGWDAYVTRYTDASPENACIVAQWKGSKGESGTTIQKQTS